MVNFLNLYYFSVTAEELNFTTAAKRLFISQQSLSNHISGLEREFGVVLFNRTRPITLTEAGALLLQSSKELLSEKAQIEKAMQDIRDFRKGELSIGVPTSRGAIVLPKILPQFNRSFPQIKLNLVEGTTQQINQALYEGRTDLNIGFVVNDPERVREQPLYEERIVCVIPKSLLAETQLAKNTAHPEEQMRTIFSSFPFLKMTSNTWLGSVFDELCRRLQTEPRLVLETGSLATLVSLCATGMGAILLPASFVNQELLFWSPFEWQQQVSIFPIGNLIGGRSIVVSWLKGHYIGRAAAEFMRLTEESFLNFHAPQHPKDGNAD